MQSESLIVILAVGLIAGWLAGQIVQGTGYGLINDLVIGVIGAFIGGWLLPRARHTPWLGHYRRDHQRHDRRGVAAPGPSTRSRRGPLEKRMGEPLGLAPVARLGRAPTIGCA